MRARGVVWPRACPAARCACRAREPALHAPPRRLGWCRGVALGPAVRFGWHPTCSHPHRARARVWRGAPDEVEATNEPRCASRVGVPWPWRAAWRAPWTWCARCGCRCAGNAGLCGHCVVLHLVTLCAAPARRPPRATPHSHTCTAVCRDSEKVQCTVHTAHRRQSHTPRKYEITNFEHNLGTVTLVDCRHGDVYYRVTVLAASIAASARASRLTSSLTTNTSCTLVPARAMSLWLPARGVEFAGISLKPRSRAGLQRLMRPGVTRPLGSSFVRRSRARSKPGMCVLWLSTSLAPPILSRTHASREHVVFSFLWHRRFLHRPETQRCTLTPPFIRLLSAAFLPRREDGGEQAA